VGTLGLFLGVMLQTMCPTSFTLSSDGKCYYDISYLSRPATTGLQKNIEPKANGFSPKLIHLGKLLFFDPVISGDGTMSCASCHQPGAGFSDGRAQSLGKEHKSLSRSAPSLWNVAFQDRFFWDARESSLESQAHGPLFSKDEMANTPEKLETTLNEIAEYRRLFAEAFGWTFQRRIEVNDVTKALATFERTLVSFRSRYDDYVYGKYDALSEPEIRGLLVFRSFVTRCTECHTPPLFQNQQTAIIGAPDFPGLEDFGIGKIAGEPRLKGSFKVPTLRNIARTAPYMHNGSLPTLESVVKFYNDGGGRYQPNASPYLHWHIVRQGLQQQEISDLVSFLGALTDERAMPVIPTVVPSQLGGKI
jgi:cytochrome c peroxidase